MLFDRIESEGLSHYSYLIGDQGEAVVVDPRRDCDIYLDRALGHDMAIEYVLETHRNEDYVIGSVELSNQTNAQIWHADSQLPYQYGRSVEEGQVWRVGRFEIEALHTPGHTPGSMSYILHEESGEPWMIFTGDALFAGDIGRVDLLGMDRADELAKSLYDSVFDKILPLGDGVIVCPAHGTGSVCGSSISDRSWTTIGLERELNPKLQYNGKEEFVSSVSKKLERPPYFRKMERLNVGGPPVLGGLPKPTPLSPKEFHKKSGGAVILDTRKELGFGNGHVPNSLSIWLEGVPSFAGWFLPYEKPILLVGEGEYTEDVTRYLIRLGYDNMAGYLSGGLFSWHMAGKKSGSINTITVQELCSILDDEESLWILDVRSEEEVERQRIPEAEHIPLTRLLDNLEMIPKDEEIYIFCGSGLRSMIAASVLRRKGWKNPTVISGGLKGWNSISCPLEEPTNEEE